MIEKYLHGKYVECGREWPNVDCYGIVLKVREDLNLPAWPSWENAKKDDGTMDSAWADFVKTLEKCAPQVGCIAACYKGSLMRHVAIVVDFNGVLSALEISLNTGVICLPIRRLERRFKRVEYYR